MADSVQSSEREFVSRFISAYRTRKVAADSQVATDCYLKYKALENREKLGKAEFLYLWFCARINLFVTPHMRKYKFFEEEGMNFESLSYWSFTQSYTRKRSKPQDQTAQYLITYECFLEVAVYFDYPINLRSLLDRTPLIGENPKLVLLENNLMTVKSRPEIMSYEVDDNADFKDAESGKLAMYFENCEIKCDERFGVVTCRDVASYTRYTTMLSQLTYGKLSKDGKRIQKFMFPGREINFPQIVDWLRRKNIAYNPTGRPESINVCEFLGAQECEFSNEVLLSNRSFDVGGYEVYKIRGEKVFKATMISELDRWVLQDRLLAVFSELDLSIAEETISPLDLEATNISKLRSSNGLIFDSTYCRKAPKHVQPLVIKKCDAQKHLDRGKMVLIYEGAYYTTQDSEASLGYDYLGMINKFGYYDPSKSYTPVIRTYRKNHLESPGFKEIKLYLLRKSPDPNRGCISREDLLLPKSLEKYYHVHIINRDITPKEIHSKKTIIASDTKVKTAEVPDYVKSAIGYIAGRTLVKGIGTKLLECCKINMLDFLRYCEDEMYNYPDLIPLRLNDLRSNIISGKLDHRICGPLIERYRNIGLLVFGREAIVPYRYSKSTNTNHLLLYLNDDGTYDPIFIPEMSPQKYQAVVKSIRTIKDIVNKRSISDLEIIAARKPRDVDYMKVAISLVSYLANAYAELGYGVSYELIRPAEMVQRVEAIYCGCLYYEGTVRIRDARFNSDYITVRQKECRLKKNPELLRFTLGPLVGSITEQHVKILSCVDMSRYNTWNKSLESCLYYSDKCYLVGETEEVRCCIVQI